MSAPNAIEPTQTRWDLSAIANSNDDPRIENYWVEAEAAASEFADKYRGKISSLDGNALRGAIQSLEAIYNTVSKPLTYASLRFSADTGDAEIGAFLAKQRERATKLSVTLMFFELELQAASQEWMDGVLASGDANQYRNYIINSRKLSPYRLTEPEEVVMEEFANTGSRAWVRLFEETTSNHVYKLKVDGSERDATQQEIMTLLKDADRTKRQAAADALSAGLKEIERTVCFTYNTLLQDKAVEDRLRKFENAEDSRHLANELDKPTVDLVMSLCSEHYNYVARYYKVKQQILGLSELTHIDRYAPLSESEEQVSWENARDIVLDAFGAFSATMRDRGEEFFANNWIDAEPRKGKRGGAFCSYATPDTHPFLFQSYQNKLDDVMTLAHELGHGVHASLSREQSYLNFHGTLPLAELASTFGEMLVFEKLVANATPADKLALYADKIEGIFATVFRQAAMFRFEQKCHEIRRAEGELSAERFGDLWQTEQQAMFGDSVKLGEQHRTWWSYVGHFFFAPFYVYAYSFGELLVLSLYQKAKAEGAAFEAKYIEVLRRGGSLPPQELMDIVGVDLQSEAFWRGGFAAMEGFLTEFERLWSEVQPA